MLRARSGSRNRSVLSNLNDSIEVNSDYKVAATLNVSRDGQLEMFKPLSKEKVITRINSTTEEHFDV